MLQSVDTQAAWRERALIDFQGYQQLYAESIAQPDAFWAREAERLDWYQKWSRVSKYSFHSPVNIKWFLDAKLNVSVNCVDRHARQHPNRIAIIWEPEQATPEQATPEQASRRTRHITYRQLHENVGRWANLLKAHGVQKGQVVTIYLPMIVEVVYAMLACARIGAVHSVVFAGFSASALKTRICDGQSPYLITADVSHFKGQVLDLKRNVDEAAAQCPDLKRIFMVDNGGPTARPSRATSSVASPAQSTTSTTQPSTTAAQSAITPPQGPYVWVNNELPQHSSECEPAVMDAEDPLFILYTSGSTGKPKGVLHTSGGYLVYASYTHEKVFNYKPGQVYWCAADVGWITGHSYIVYGPLANGATLVMCEGAPNHTPDRIWQVAAKHKVNILYTAPTLIRALMRYGDEPVRRHNLQHLQLLGTVGEPINPKAWWWYYNVPGRKQCPIVDTWWQTETGGILISPLPGATALQPGSATHPLMGVQPVLLNDEGCELQGSATGRLCIKASWPGQMRGLYNNPALFEKTYFNVHKGYYFTGDGARRDKEGNYWITGRIDDVLNVSGHRIGTAEVESALVSHTDVSEAAVVGFDHQLKGQGIYAFVTLNKGVQASNDLRHELSQHIAKQIGPTAKPEFIHWAPELPKTRSGKIMRRVLRKIASLRQHPTTNNETPTHANQAAHGVIDSSTIDWGDLSTLADPSVVEALVNSLEQVQPVQLVL